MNSKEEERITNEMYADAVANANAVTQNGRAVMALLSITSNLAKFKISDGASEGMICLAQYLVLNPKPSTILAVLTSAYELGRIDANAQKDRGENNEADENKSAVDKEELMLKTMFASLDGNGSPFVS